MPRESFLLRIDPRILKAIRKWADDDLRSVNGQIEFLLRKALRDVGRVGDIDKRDRESKRGKGD